MLRGLAVLLLVLVATSALLAYASPQATGPGKAEVEELLDAVSYTISRLSTLGFDVSKALELLSRAREALEVGDLGRARSLALQSLVTAGSSVRATVRSPAPVGLVLEASLLRSLAEDLGLQEVLEVVGEAERSLARGDVDGAARALGEARRVIRAAQAEVAGVVAGRAVAEVEGVLKEVAPAEVVVRLVEVARGAKVLKELAPVARVARLVTWFRSKVLEALEEVYLELEDVDEEALEEVGGLPPELTVGPEVRGLVAKVRARYEALVRLRFAASGELARALARALNALGNLTTAIEELARCSPTYASYLDEAVRASEEALAYLSRARVAVGPQVAVAQQVHAVALWARSVARYLPNYVHCPVEGVGVLFRGIVVDVLDSYVLAYGVAAVPGARVGGLRLGLYALNIGGVAVGVSRGDVVEALGTYVGLGRLGYPEVVVEKLWLVKSLELPVKPS